MNHLTQSGDATRRSVYEEQIAPRTGGPRQCADQTRGQRSGARELAPAIRQQRPHVSPRLTMVAFAVLHLCAPAYAAELAAPGATEATAIPAETIYIAGQRASLRRALAAQQKADNIVSVVSSDDIGGLPDKNAAEALARLPGVAVQRDQSTLR